MNPKNTEEDFWKKVDKTSDPNGCWIWTGAKNVKNNGYGKFYFNNKSIPAHRYSISLTGKDPAGWEVLHSCDNPPCVNPAHLRLGTHAENMKEAKDRKRFPGSAGILKKFSIEEIKEIRSAKVITTKTALYKKLAKQYDSHPSTISEIYRGARGYANIIKEIL